MADERRRSRRTLWIVLAVCAAPLVASAQPTSAATSNRGRRRSRITARSQASPWPAITLATRAGEKDTGPMHSASESDTSVERASPAMSHARRRTLTSTSSTSLGAAP